ncbi:MAG: hypothetical protein JXA13_02540 [Anaerolineales bacterium]|nr:hypothetical protein [Anaerolineales bacterium]
MAVNRYLPDSNRLSILSAMVLFAYAISNLVQAPQITLDMQLPGLYLAIPLNLNTVITLLAAGLTAAGMRWLLSEHPSVGNGMAIDHWFLPTLTTLVLGAPLALLPPGHWWWLGFSIGAFLLVLIFFAEYVVVEPAAPYYALATVGLTALSFALFLILVVAFRYSGVRLLLTGPAVFLAAGLVSLRTLHLRLLGRWQFAWAFGIGLICMQLAAGLHYWPIFPLQFGLFILGPLYALNGIAGNLSEGIPLKQAFIEPVTVLVLIWGGALLVG